MARRAEVKGRREEALPRFSIETRSVPSEVAGLRGTGVRAIETPASPTNVWETCHRVRSH